MVEDCSRAGTLSHAPTWEQISIKLALMSTNEDYAGIGRRIGAYRRLAGLTAQQLADEVPGLTRSGLAKIEAGLRAVLPVELVLGIAWALKVPPTAIMFPLGMPAKTINLAGEDVPMHHAYFWAVGPRENERDEWQDSPAAHGSAMVENARLYVSLGNEISERWGDNGELATTDEDKRKYLEEVSRQRNVRKALAWMDRQLPYRNVEDDGDN